jgi:sugar lactone lactonase YvrE
MLLSSASHGCEASPSGILSPGAIQPRHIALDPSGALYLSDARTHGVYRLSREKATRVPEFEGSRPLGEALALEPSGLAADGDFGLVVADAAGRRVRQFDLRRGTISTLAGSGQRSLPGADGPGLPATTIALSRPVGVSVDSRGDVWIADPGAQRLLRFERRGGLLWTVAGDGISGDRGDGGPAHSARLAFPESVAVDAAGNVWVADRGNHKLRRIDRGTGVISTLAGDGRPGSSGDGGPSSLAQLSEPMAVVLEGNGDLLVADSGNRRLRRIRDGTIDTVVVLPGRPVSLAVARDGRIFVSSLDPSCLFTLPPSGRLSEEPVGLAGDCYKGSP